MHHDDGGSISVRFSCIKCSPAARSRSPVTGVIGLNATTAFLADRRGGIDEIGLVNPSYMALHYGKMTYPVHGCVRCFQLTEARFSDRIAARFRGWPVDVYVSLPSMAGADEVIIRSAESERISEVTLHEVDLRMGRP